jgi:hypothetical protein
LETRRWPWADPGRRWRWRVGWSSDCARPKHWTELTLPQCRAHMSMWTILKSPLLASADLTTVNRSRAECVMTCTHSRFSLCIYLVGMR